MIVNSAKEFRTWVKNKDDRYDINENFIGSYYEENNKKIKGFFNLFHGKKKNIETYLPSLLDIAEDNQAIYEFLQNAVDCGSTHFYAFYNDKYFLAVNNGKKFSLEGLESILNIAQSTKTDASNIGRLGIGFKLAHRLVGKGNGTRELVHGNKGPIMFSWDRSEDLKALMSEEEIEFEGLEDNAFLLKIAITNFPTQVDEEVKDVNYNDNVVFPNAELIEFRSYVTECLGELYANDNTCFNQGTLFFIKLGENKRELLDGDLETLRNGIEYSMNTLKQLENICFNGETIVKKSLVINENFISKETEKFNEIDPQYPDYDILYSFGFITLDFKLDDYISSVKKLQESPNFYKYFPMGDEVDNMALFVHSDSFQIEANRRKLTNHHTNKKLLPEIAKYIVNTLNQYRNNDRVKYLQLYASILLTSKPSASEKSWMNDVFFNIIFESIRSSAPTIEGDESDLNYVKIKDVKMDIPLDKIGLSNYKWFYWYGDRHKEIIDSAYESNKLDLYKWNINDIIEKCDINHLNTWLASCSIDEFEEFLDEIKSTTTTNKAKDLLPKIKLFIVGNERKSYNDIVGDNDYIIVISKIANIIPILNKIGVKCTNDILENHKLSSLIKSQKEEDIFKIIKTKVEATDKWPLLSAYDKLSIVTVLKDLENVGDASIKKLNIFKNILGNQCALENLAAYKEFAEDWQKPYVICKEENFTEVQKYLINSDTALSDIVESNFKDIIEEGTSINELYNIYVKNNFNWTDDLTIKIINEYGCTEDVLSLIEKNPSKTAVDEFIKKLDVINLNSTLTYPPTSFEYRCIKVAAKEEATSLRNKIKIDDINLTNFTTSNELTFRCKNKQGSEKSYSLKLSDILPNDTQCALYGKVAEMFSSINNYKTIFSADSSDSSSVQRSLKDILSNNDVIITPAQFIFILLLNFQKGNSSFFNWGGLIRFNENNESPESVITRIISYSFEHGITEPMIEYKSLYLIRQYFENKYLFSNEYTLESERAFSMLGQWCENDSLKKDYLKSLGVHFDDSTEIKRRKKFVENALTEWDGDKFPNSFITWVASLPSIDGDNQKKLLYSISNKFNNIYLKQEFDEVDYSEAEELDTLKYLAWKPSKAMSIYKIDSKMPIRLVYNKEKILTRINDGAYKYFQDTKHLYVNAIKEEDIASVLAQVYQDKTIPFDYQDYISICFDSPEEVKAKDLRLKELEEENKQFRDLAEQDAKEKAAKNRAREEYLNEYSTRVKEFMGGDFTMPSDKVKSEHIITRYRALMYLKKRNEYPLKSGFDEKSYVRTDGYAPIPLSSGKHINVQGAKFGIWHLSTVIWNDIVGKGNYACLCTGNGENDFMLIKTEEDIKRIAESTKNVFMRMTPTNSVNIMDTIKSVISTNQVVFDEDIFIKTMYNDRDVHLMLMVHPTKEPALNSMFDRVFHEEGDFNISELG